MTVPLLDLKAQFEVIRDDVMSAILAVIEGQRFIMGEEVERLEAAVAEFCGAGHAISCASGTDALLLSLKGLRLSPGDEVITSPFSFFATAGAIANSGATPVFVDIDPATFNIDPQAVEGAITPDTRAIVPVHLFGQMASIERLRTIANGHGLALVEDAAQALGARRCLDGAWCAAGTVGRAGAFSFFPSKNLGGWGDGGLIVTDDDELAEDMRLLRTHGGAKQYHHEVVGTNSRLDTLQAAVLLAKLPHLTRWNAARREHATHYDEAFARIDAVTCPTSDPANEHVYHQYVIRTPRRDALRAYLLDKGIGCAVYYPKPLHVQPCFAPLGYQSTDLPHAVQASAEVLALPMFPELRAEQRDMVIEAISEFAF